MLRAALSLLNATQALTAAFLLYQMLAPSALCWPEAVEGDWPFVLGGVDARRTPVDGGAWLRRRRVCVLLTFERVYCGATNGNPLSDGFCLGRPQLLVPVAATALLLLVSALRAAAATDDNASFGRGAVCVLGGAVWVTAAASYGFVMRWRAVWSLGPWPRPQLPAETPAVVVAFSAALSAVCAQLYLVTPQHAPH